MDIITAIVLVLVFITIEYSHNLIVTDLKKDIEWHIRRAKHLEDAYDRVLQNEIEEEKETDAEEFEQAKVNSAYYKGRYEAMRDYAKTLYNKLEEQNTTALENHTMD